MAATGWTGLSRRVFRGKTPPPASALSGDGRRRSLVMLNRRRPGGMGEDRRRVGEREDFEHNEREDIEEGVPSPQTASEQTKIFATHDRTYLHTVQNLPHSG